MQINNNRTREFDRAYKDIRDVAAGTDHCISPPLDQVYYGMNGLHGGTYKAPNHGAHGFCKSKVCQVFAIILHHNVTSKSFPTPQPNQQVEANIADALENNMKLLMQYGAVPQESM